MEIKNYMHTVHYYETDKMAITHHSNYIRWMEEARVNFLDQIGWGFDKMEAMGIASPVLEVNCKYKHSTVFNQKVSIQVSVKEFKGLKLYIDYVICDAESQKVCATGTSCHCFLNSEGKPIFMEKEYPDFFTIMNSFVKK